MPCSGVISPLWDIYIINSMNYGGCRKGAALKYSFFNFHQLGRSETSHPLSSVWKWEAPLRSRDAWRTLLGFRSPVGRSAWWEKWRECSFQLISHSTRSIWWCWHTGNNVRDVIQIKELSVFEAPWITSWMCWMVSLHAAGSFWPLAASNFHNMI